MPHVPQVVADLRTAHAARPALPPPTPQSVRSALAAATGGGEGGGASTVDKCEAALRVSPRSSKEQPVDSG